MKINEKLRQDSMDYLSSNIDTILDYGNREAGSNGETLALDHLEKEMNEVCSEVKREKFNTRPLGFMAWTYFVPTFGLLSLILFFFSPLMSIISLIIGLVPFIVEFLFYVPMLDKLTEKRQSSNLIGTISPKGKTTRRIVLNSNIDTTAVWNLNKSHNLFYIIIGLTIAGYVYVLTTDIAAICTTGIIGTPTGWVLYMGIASVIWLIPFIYMYFFNDSKETSLGANKNLAACELILTTLKALKESHIQLNNTELVALITGSSESCLDGPKAFVKNNPNYGKEEDIETIFISYDSLKDLNNLSVYDKDMNSLVSNNPSVAKLIEDTCNLNNISLKHRSTKFRATNASVFSKAGLKATCLTAKDPTLTPDYNTPLDNKANVNMDTLASILDLTTELIDEFDKNGLK